MKTCLQKTLFCALLAALLFSGCKDLFHPEGPEKPNPGSGDGSAPSVPSSVTANAVSSDTIIVSWYPVDWASGYKVYRSSSPYGGYSLRGESPSDYDASYTDYGLSSSTTYYYKVSAYNSYGESAQSSYASATTQQSGGQNPVPSVPSSVTANAMSSDTIIVSWYPVDWASGYKVYRSSSPYSGYSLWGESPPDYDPSYTDYGLSPNTTYYYKVSAYNSSGESAQSNYAATTTNSSSNGEGGISNITYSTVSGGEWTVESDGSRKSPTISHGALTKSRVSFTSNSSNTSITIQLMVSSESNCDFAFISQLDTASASSTSGYHTNSKISGSTTVIVTIPVSSSGSHFVDIGYSKDESINIGSDCAWFTVIL
jgi:hypothetical protein